MIFNKILDGLFSVLEFVISLFPKLSLSLDLTDVSSFIKTEIFDRIAYFVPVTWILGIFSLYLLVIHWDFVVRIFIKIWEMIPGN